MINRIKALLDKTRLDEDLKAFLTEYFSTNNNSSLTDIRSTDHHTKDDDDSSLDMMVGYLEKLAKPQQRLRQYHALSLTQDLPTGAHLAMQGKPVLLFVHGIFGSFPGIFEKLLADRHAMSRLATRYASWMLGWDHWTVTESAFDNAKALAAALPANTHIDIVCHSRGGLVVRSLLEHPDVQPLLQARHISIGTVIYVGAAYEGNALASDSNSLLVLLGNFIQLAKQESDADTNSCSTLAARTLLALANDIQDLPGIDCLSPDASGYIRRTRWQKPLSQRYAYVRSSFALSGSELQTRINRRMADILQDASDFVVPYAGAGLPGATIMTGGRLEFTAPDGGYQDAVHHLNYFAQQKVRDFLLRILLDAENPA